MAARTAVVAGTATAVSGRVARRQQRKYGEQDADYMEQQGAAMAQGAQAATGGDDATAELERLAQLHTQGVLTDEEFAAAKKKALGI
jgi:Short C-terminal domain